MKTHFLLFLASILLLTSCESEQQKLNRMELDKAARKLSKTLSDIQTEREQEGQQSQLTIGSFYNKYLDKIDDVENDLAEMDLDEKYKPNVERITRIASEVGQLLTNRKSAISATSDLSSAWKMYSYYSKQRLRYLYSTYSYGSSYRSEIIEEESNIRTSALAYQIALAGVGKSEVRLDSMLTEYNLLVSDSRLQDSLLTPKSFSDSTQTDWLKTILPDLQSYVGFGLDSE